MSDKAWVEMTRKEQAAHLSDLRERFPTGCRVRVVASDAETEAVYVGKTGTVTNDSSSDDAPPLLTVEFDEPHGRVKADGFFEDEIERVR